MDEHRARAKRGAARTGLLFAPFFLASLAGFIWAAIALGQGQGRGLIFTLVIAGIIAILTGYQTIQSLRDWLESEPRQLEGAIRRTWSRHDYFLFRSNYILVEGQVFRVEPEDFLDLAKGQRVRVFYYPHANTLDRVERVKEE